MKEASGGKSDGTSAFYVEFCAEKPLEWVLDIQFPLVQQQEQRQCTALQVGGWWLVAPAPHTTHVHPAM